MRRWPHALILAGALLLAAPAAAQPPGLIGTWKGAGYVVSLGPSHYRTTKDVEAAFPDKAVEFTYVIKEQHGHRFAGEMSSEKGKRTFIGAMQQDNRGGIILDNNGQYIFTLIDPGTIDMCYSCQYPDNKQVVCFRLKRAHRQATK
jgi:hypothetical protein